MSNTKEEKKKQIKQLEQEINLLWQNLYNTYYIPRINSKYLKSTEALLECLKINDQNENQRNQCIQQQLSKQEKPIKYLKNIFHEYHSGFEDCIFNCKYSINLELEDCYIDCFTQSKIIIEQLHFQ